jgi:hypothetical protein
MNGNRESQTFGQSKPRLNVWKRAKMGYNSSVWLLILIVIRVSRGRSEQAQRTVWVQAIF